MGADLEVSVTGDAMGEPVGRIRARASRLRGTLVAGDLALRAIDEIPALTVAAALAEGETTFADLAELRVKESDRIAALARELGRAGVTVAERPDGLVVTGSAPARPPAARSPPSTITASPWPAPSSASAPPTRRRSPPPTSRPRSLPSPRPCWI